MYYISYQFWGDRMYEYYYESINNKEIPEFLLKYLNCPSILRLKNIGYFCGMDYASKDIYDFGEYISRFDHSLDVALITYKYTKNKEATIAGLCHDIATPCFSHVIDYMNKDYSTQESTEKLTDVIIKNDKKLLDCLKEDEINPDDIIDFKKYTIVDNDRPKLCADRIDGVILTGLFWTKNISKNDIDMILKHLDVYKNENDEFELGFNDLSIANKVMEVSESINTICHSDEDNYMMELLADLTKYAIANNYISYINLYIMNEKEVHEVFKNIQDESFKKKYYQFQNIKKEEIIEKEMPYIKKRNLKLLVNGKRM